MNFFPEQPFGCHTLRMPRPSAPATSTAKSDGAAPDSESSHFPATLLYTAARLYYEDEATQAEIAEKLGTSRATVSRLLAEAKRQGVVRIEVVAPAEARPTELADRVARALNLNTVYLSPPLPTPSPGRSVVDIMGRVLAPATARALSEAGACGPRGGEPHGAVHAELRRVCGGPEVARATVAQLQARIEVLRRRVHS